MMRFWTSIGWEGPSEGEAAAAPGRGAPAATRISQRRSTSHQAPSWAYISSVGSVGENWKWFSQSVEWRSSFTAPVWRLTVIIVRSEEHTSELQSLRHL